MSGNVWEWTSSLYADYPYDASDGRERDTGNSTDVWRVARGGSFLNLASHLHAANRNKASTVDVKNYFGFRCVRDVE